jgi:two-component system chemotaxis sensor kinase CheA
MVRSDDDLVFLFHAESTDLLDGMEDALLKIQDEGQSDELVNLIFRALHTIKGGAATFQFSFLVEFVHNAESLIDKIRNKSLELSDEIIEFLFEVKDHINTLIEEIIQNDCKETYDDSLALKTSEYIVKLKRFLNSDITKKINKESQSIKSDVKKDKSKESENEIISKIDERLKPEIEEIEREFKHAEPNPLEMQNIIQSKIEQINQNIKETQEKRRAPQTAKNSETKPKQQVLLKIESSKIDTIINLLGEMVITTASVIQHANRINDKPLKESIDELYKILEELREASMRSRMVPIGDTFNRFKRIVKELAGKLNKKVELKIEGAETELDRVIIDKISDPIIHLIRNSIDHGIEEPQKRVELGKDEVATVTLSAFHEAGSIIIKVSDDGSGLDKNKIIEKAVEKEIIKSGDNLNKGEIYNLIMQPGFSTSSSISDVSGRGVGMDVVKKNIEELRGSIEIESESGEGTTISIRLPLTLAIIDGFMVKISSQPYIIPLEMIIECIELTKEYKEFIKANRFINLREQVLPVLDLREFFNYEIKDENVRDNIVIVQFGMLRVGLVVDELLGEFQTVIKPMGKVFKDLKGIGGATILGDGRISPILDIPMLLKYANEQINKES